MQNDFRLRADISVIRDKTPIRFVHNKTMDKPEHHVLHLNNYVEIYIYVSGNHNYIVGNNLYELKPGDIVVINPLEVHKALPMGETPYERFYFLIDCDTFDCMHPNPLTGILSKPSDTGNLISLDRGTRHEVLDMLYQISDCFREGRDDQLRAFGYFMRILDEINRHFKGVCPSDSDITQTPDLLKKILTYVEKHAAQIESITEISTSIGVTPQYLSSYFSRQIGTPLKTYIQAKKIALAKDLLDKGADVTRACYECGFNDCSYFIRVFKKYVGMTPMSYKKGKLCE